jgi:hypothetical protein
MSNKYKHGDIVPTEVLAERLDELSDRITKGDTSQFVMRIPAELDHCPDLVMSAASQRLEQLQADLAAAEDLTTRQLSVIDRLTAEVAELKRALDKGDSK